MTKPDPTSIKASFLYMAATAVLFGFLLFLSLRHMKIIQSHFVVPRSRITMEPNQTRLYELKSQSVFTLCEMLHDKDWQVREQSAKALGETRDYKAVDSLIAALKDQDPGVRWTAVWALGEIGNKRAIESLLAVCTEFDNGISPEINTWSWRERILEKSEQTKHKGDENEPPTFTGVDVQREAVRALIKIDRGEAKKRLIPLIEKEKRAGILAAMELNDHSILGDLLQLLSALDSDKFASWRMIQDIETALQRMACPEIIQTYLFGKLFKQEERVMQQVVKGMDSNTVLAAIVPALQNQHLEVRQRALDLLYFFWNVPTKNEIIRLLDDKDTEISNSAWRILAARKDPSLKKFYIKKLQDQSPTVRESAAESLLRMGDLRAIGILLSAKSSCYNAECLVHWLGELGNEEARRLLLSFLGNWNVKDDSICTRAYYAALKLGELKEKRATPNLTRMLQGGNSKEKNAAKTALIKLGDTRLMPEILEKLVCAVSRKSSKQRQLECLYALQDIASPVAAASLVKIFHSEIHWQESDYTAVVFDTFKKCFSDPLIPILQKELGNSAPWFRIRAAEILGNSRNKKALSALMPALHDSDRRVRKIALDALGAAKLISKSQLLQFIHDEQDWLIKSAAIDILHDYSVDPVDVHALLKKNNVPFFVRHKLIELVTDNITRQMDAVKPLPASELPPFAVVSENGISQMEYDNSGNEFRVTRMVKLSGYRHLVQSRQFLFAINDHAIARLTNKLQPDKSIELNRIGSCASFNDLLFLSADGYLVILDEDLKVLSRLSLGVFEGYSGKRKNAHDLLISRNVVYLLDNISEPIFTLKIDATDPKKPQFLQETEIEFINHHLDAQWIAPEQNEWRIIQSSSHMGGAFQWLLKFSLISGKLKDRVLFFRDLEDPDSYRRIDGWIEALDPYHPDWMVIRKDNEYFLAKLSMQTGELLKEGLFSLGTSTNSRFPDESQWKIRQTGDLLYVFNASRLWVIRPGKYPEILVYQEFPQKILDVTFPTSQVQ